MKYSVVSYSFEGEALDKTLDRLARLGYDGIELPCVPWINPKEAKEKVQSQGLEVSFITGIWGGAFAPSPRDLLSEDESLRRAGLAYIRECIDYSYSLNAGGTMVCFAAWNGISKAPREKLWKMAVEELKSVDGYARDRGVKLCVEPLLRYEAHIVNTIHEAERMIKEIGSDNFGILADTYAMHLEEVSVPDTIKRTPAISHVHLVDSNRLAPGLGAVDFRGVLKALKENEYDGYGSVEFMRPFPDYDTAAKASIDYLRATEEVLDLAERAAHQA